MKYESLRKSVTIVRQQIEKAGYEWISGEYENANSKLLLHCPKGHTWSVQQISFQQGHRCFICSYDIRAEKTRKSFAKIIEAFAKEGYEVLSKKYQNNRQGLTVRCPKGHITRTLTWNNFDQSGRRCSVCAGKATSLELVKKYIEKSGYSLISTKYYGTHSKSLVVKCPKGHKYSTRWNDFQQGYRCPKCKERKQEKKLGEILEQIFPGQVTSQDNLGFLSRLRVDYSVRDVKLAFEYDGEQHFLPICFGRETKQEADIQLQKQQVRDRKKDRLCKSHGYQLIRVSYKDELTLESIKNRLVRQEDVK